jgi:excinuclease ABC subunit A
VLHLSRGPGEAEVSTLSTRATENGSIEVRGARVHNLKNIDCSIPLGKLTVITGPSGSGKSSLAFDTLYAEGRRRFVESLTSYARQFLERLPRPDVESITLLPPSIGVQHTNAVTSARSTVGTASELLDLLRLLYARAGETRCPDCRTRVKRDTPQSAADRLLQLPEGTRVTMTARIDLPKDPDGKTAILAALRRQGYDRIYRSGRVAELKGTVSAGHVEVVVDSLRIKPEHRTRAVEAAETALRLGGGKATARLESRRPLSFSTEISCSRCGRRFPPLTDKMFSFNSPIGACPECRGFGRIIDVDMEKVVPQPALSLEAGAMAPWQSPAYRRWRRKLLPWAREAGIPTDKPFSDLEPRQQDLVVSGDKNFPGVRGFFRWLQSKKYKTHVRVLLSRYRGYYRCPVCHGTRLKPDAHHVFISGKHLPELCDMTIQEAERFFRRLRLSGHRGAGLGLLVDQIRERLRYLVHTGLGYVSLSRQTRTLSGGEYQRLGLARALGSGLTGTLYVLDEPTVGLHPRDTASMLRILEQLTEEGNTVVVVEHDPQVIASADHMVDLGPSAGRRGGQVLYAGPPGELAQSSESPTARALTVGFSTKRRTRRRARGRLRILGAREHNLRSLDVDIPLGTLCCVTGVSGSGKSTLVENVLYGTYKRIPAADRYGRGACEGIEGLAHILDMIMVDQEPLARSPRSIPITYLRAWDSVRKALAATPTARSKGLKPSHFSFNVPGGRCDACCGTGVEELEMQFVADVTLVCEACGGKRFKPAVLEATYRGLNVDRILTLTAEEAIHHLAPLQDVVRKLDVLVQLGLGYLRLGQPLSTLSAGEAQRLKLARYLEQPRGGGVLFLLDEPTTGLHPIDISVLLACFERLLDAGHSIVAIEHNMQVVAASDYVIDLGPGGGEEGGRVVAAGTPEEVAASEASHTAPFLRALV